MVLMASQHIPDYVIRQMMASAIQLVVHSSRLVDGTRKIMEISEVVGADRDTVDTQTIFELERT
jgi:pilus assembly protein CpaF